MGVSDLVTWLAFAAAQLADMWTTNRALRAPGLKEAHPLWRWVQRRMGRAWWIARLLAGAGVAVGLWWALASLVPVGVTAHVTGAVAADDWRLARGVQGRFKPTFEGWISENRLLRSGR